MLFRCEQREKPQPGWPQKASPALIFLVEGTDQNGGDRGGLSAPDLQSLCGVVPAAENRK